MQGNNFDYRRSDSQIRYAIRRTDSIVVDDRRLSCLSNVSLNLQHLKDLELSFIESSGLMTWTETARWVASRGGRLASVRKIRELIAKQAGKPEWVKGLNEKGALVAGDENGSSWVACGTSEAPNWVQIGGDTTNGNYPGKVAYEHAFCPIDEDLASPSPSWG